MIEIFVGNSYSRIQGLSPKQEIEVRKALSYKLPNYRGHHFRSVTRYLIDRHGSFPTGLLKLLEIKLQDFNLTWKVADNRFRPASHPSKFRLIIPFEPYEEQLDAVYAAYISHRGMISMPTGSGKAATIALLINELQVRTLVIVPNLTLKRQLTKSFNEWFGDTVKNITIENIDSKNLKNLNDFDCLICDEAHHVAAKTYINLNKKTWNNTYYRFFFTATPYRSLNEEQILMESISGQVIYSLSYKKAIDKGIIVPLEAYYVDLSKTSVKGRNWSTVYKELVTDRKDRNKILSVLAWNFYNCKISALFLVKEISHGDKLTWNGAFAFANGQDKNTSDFIYDFTMGNRKVLIATTGVAGEGVDTKACEYVIIAGLGKSKNQFMQAVGRALRRFPGKESGKVILFRDKSHKWTLAHFNAQVKFLKEEFGIIPIKLEI